MSVKLKDCIIIRPTSTSTFLEVEGDVKIDMKNCKIFDAEQVELKIRSSEQEVNEDV